MAGPTNELIIETADGVRYGVKDLAKAQKRFPDLKVISYADGRPFEEAQAQPTKPKRKRSPAKRKAAPATDPVTAGTVPASEETSDGAEQS